MKIVSLKGKKIASLLTFFLKEDFFIPSSPLIVSTSLNPGIARRPCTNQYRKEFSSYRLLYHSEGILPLTHLRKSPPGDHNQDIGKALPLSSSQIDRDSDRPSSQPPFLDRFHPFYFWNFLFKNSFNPRL